MVKYIDAFVMLVLCVLWAERGTQYPEITFSSCWTKNSAVLWTYIKRQDSLYTPEK